MKIRILASRRSELYPGAGLFLSGPRNDGGAVRGSLNPVLGSLNPRPPSVNVIQPDYPTIARRLSAIPGFASSELHYDDGTIAIDIDAAGVKLRNIATGAFAKFYPTGVLGYENGTKSVLIDDDGVTVDDSSSDKSVLIAKDKVHVRGPGSGSTLKETLIDGSGVVLSNGTNTLILNHSAITNNMQIREVDVCSGGEEKKMLIIASSAYAP